VGKTVRACAFNRVGKKVARQKNAAQQSWKERQSGRERGNHVIFCHMELGVVAVDACKLMLFDGGTYRRNVAEHHQ